MLRTPVERKIVLIGFVTVVIVGFMTNMSLRLYVTYKTANDLARLETQFSILVKENKIKEEALEQRLTEFSRTLYAVPPETPQSPRRPSYAETVWQKNRDEALFKRLSALEAWRYRMER